MLQIQKFWKNMNRKKLAKFGEDIAAQFLENNDYEILKRNYHSVYGEIDIICKKDNQLIFVEVKARQSDKFGGPLDAITENKKDKISPKLRLFQLQI